MTDYRTSAAQDAIDVNLMALGLTGASAGDLVRVNAVDANGKPTSWKHVPLCEIKTNPNLLDNWLFTNPVNQRGQTTWQNAGEYTVDRWKLTSGTASLGASGLTLNGTLVQIGETTIGMPVICSALLSDGSIITPTYDDSTKTYTIAATGQTIKAVKLELGSEQTLAHLENGVWVLNEIPDYGQELAKCQRYQLVLGYSDGFAVIGVGNCISATEVSITVSTPVTLHHTSSPSASLFGSGSVLVRNEDTVTTVTGIILDAPSQSAVFLRLTATGLSTGKVYEAFTTHGAKILIDCNL